MTTAVDASGNGHDGTYQGSPTGATGLVTGDANTAAQVRSATDDYVVENDTITPGTFSTLTIGGVVQWHGSTANAAAVFGIADVVSAFVKFDINAIQQVSFEIADDSATGAGVQSVTTLSADTTYDIVCTWDGTTMKVYIDGTLDASGALAGPLTIAEALAFYAGTDQFGTTGNVEFDGTLDELFCSFTHVASTGEVTAIHAARTGTGSIATAIAAVSPDIYWRLGELGGGTPTVYANLLDASPTFFAPAVGRAGEIAVPLLDASPSLDLPGGAGSTGGGGGTTGSGTPTVGQPTVAAGAAAPAFRLERRTIAGAGAATLASAQPEDITWTLNAPTELTFSFPKHTYTETQIPTLANTTAVYEYLAYYDENLLAKGLMIQPDASADQGAVVCHCADRLWVMNRRNLDAPFTNFVTNGGFESGFTGWTQVGSFTKAVDTTHKALGTQSAKLDDINTNADDFISQRFTAGPNAVGLALTVSAYRLATVVTGTSELGSRGLFIQGSQHGVLKDYNYAAIDEADPYIGQWHQDVTTIWIPPGQSWDMEVRAYAVCGTIYWDAIQVIAMESIGSTSVTGSATAEADIADIARILAAFVQDGTKGKSQLFVGNRTPATGTKLFRQYQYIDHVSFASAIAEFVGRDDGFDISLEITPTTATFTTWTPKKGTNRSGTVTLTYGGNVANYRYSRSGQAAITRETMMGQGNGVARDEQEYADTSQVGGLVLQEVRQAPPEAALNSLLPLARERVTKRRVPPLVLELDLRPDAGLINTLQVGDKVTVALSDGYAQAAGVHRIVQLKLNCRSRVLTVFVNEDL